MSLTKIAKEDDEREKEIQQQLFECIDTSTSFVFNSGAGAGKTYALVECLKYVVKKYGQALKEHNQKIMCITYTNVAANHIKDKVGNSELVQVSTIHERIWSLIKRHQPELVKIHIEKVQSELEKINLDIEQNDKFQFFRDMKEDERADLKAVLFEKKDIYYESYSLNAEPFRDKMRSELRIPDNVMKNVGNFKSLVGKLYKISSYTRCLEAIEEKKKGYNVVEYNPLYNYDKLEKMRISHDTLLEYGEKIIEKYPRMKKIVIDQYPYIFIDEFQDTANRVVNMMDILDLYSKEVAHPLVVGYYGDMLQNIYEDGVGEELTNIHKDLKVINKEYNRRSHKEIIDVANAIRNDLMNQKSIYTNCEGGCVEFYDGGDTDIKKFIDECVSKMGANVDNPLHCLFTTNQLVAEYSGFTNLYNVFKEASKYKGANYQQLNTELLGDDDVKLGKTQGMLSRIMQLLTDLEEPQTPLRRIMKSEEWREISLFELREIISKLRKIEGDTFGALLNSIFDIYNNTNNDIYRKIINNIFDLTEEASYNVVINKIVEDLFSDDKDVETKIKEFTNITTVELKKWYMYRKGTVKADKQYHTYHSTKGLEFENVIIILENDFGVQKKYFTDFFKGYDEDDKEKFKYYKKARNLLYVAVTRAIKNLTILHIGDISGIEGGIKKICNKIMDREKESEKNVSCNIKYYTCESVMEK